MADVTFEDDAPDTIVRVDGVIIGRLTGQDANRQMQWRAGHDYDQEKVEAFDHAYAAGDRSPEAARQALKKAGLA
ncbi:hypothetical protein [Aurantimonas sp. VKM B-3413]|uniref:hypothetical protein n=1 Tax=Aurantimonas sp. VKM B-3413 TaxID=2779401 RepID=UPI001E546F50|nr:hypothetical protein [Aurantimonas sp. VKM B-3413]MCB8838550.1 hypothetical protein [Aurantimonas sp. VKM B-3413]